MDHVFCHVRDAPTLGEQRSHVGAVEKALRLAVDKVVVRRDAWLTDRAIPDCDADA